MLHSQKSSHSYRARGYPLDTKNDIDQSTLVGFSVARLNLNGKYQWLLNCSTSTEYIAYHQVPRWQVLQNCVWGCLVVSTRTWKRTACSSSLASQSVSADAYRVALRGSSHTGTKQGEDPRDHRNTLCHRVSPHQEFSVVSHRASELALYSFSICEHNPIEVYTVVGYVILPTYFS